MGRLIFNEEWNLFFEAKFFGIEEISNRVFVKLKFEYDVNPPTKFYDLGILNYAIKDVDANSKISNKLSQFKDIEFLNPLYMPKNIKENYNDFSNVIFTCLDQTYKLHYFL